MRWQVPEHLRGRAGLALYAEALFGPELARQVGLELLDPAPDWLVRLPYEYRLRIVELSTLGQARELPQARFIKPPNDKSFPAAVYRGAELPQGFDEAMPVLVAEVVSWEQEYRCFVAGRRLMTYSIYSRHGELQREAGFHSSAEEDAQVVAFLERLLADERVDLPEAVVVDVGHIAGRGWACVELNAAWGAGLYGCDAERALQVIGAAARAAATG